MKIVRGFAIVLFVLCLLLVIVPVAAQSEVTATAEPTVAIIDTGGEPVGDAPVVSPVETSDPSVLGPKDWILVAVIVALLAFLALAIRPLIIQLGQSAPKWAVEAAFSSANSLIEAALKRASETASPLDDTVVNELREEMERLRRDIMGAPAIAASLRAKGFPVDPDYGNG